MKYNTQITKRFSPWAWLMFIVICVIFIFLNYAGTEGLNPSDDGVILAQSWRIINGEIPHLDFISIRPVGSGVLHSIHFLIPFPLEISARYFVLFQFFIIAFCWVQFFRLKSKFKHKLPISYQISILLIAWIFTIYNYNLFPWTTIDAIFWSSLGFYLIERGFNNRRKFIPLSIGLIAFAMAAISRQTFALIAIFGWLWTAARLIERKKWKTGLFAFAIGSIPLLIYALIIAKNDAGRAFLSQMSGRTEFYKTAIKSFYDHFNLCKIKGLNIFVLTFAIVGGIAKFFSIKIRSFFATLPAFKIMFAAETTLILYLLFRSSQYFFSDKLDIEKLPFLAFWILLDMCALCISVQDKKFSFCTPAWFALLIAWVSAISLGDNAPVFCFGILSISIIWLYLNKYQDTIILKQHWLKFALPILALFFIIIGTRSQFEVNYRDVPRSKQTHNLNDINSCFGNIMTNENTWNYFHEVDSIIKELKNKNERFCILPDNAIIYPLYRIKNPLSIDWAQNGEIVNQMERFNQEMFWLMDEHVVFVIQKVTSTTMYDGFEAIKQWPYSYFKILTRYSTIIEETEHFIIYKK